MSEVNGPRKRVMEHIMSQDVITRLTRTEAKLDAIVDKVDWLTHSLFGNGQPGVIATIVKRLTRLEWYLALSIGGCSVVLYILDKVWR